MRPGPFHFACYWILTWLRRIVVSLIVVALLAPVLPTFGIRQLEGAVTFLAGNNKVINVALTVLWGSLTFLRNHVGPPWLWDCIKGILDKFQKTVFTDVGAGELSDHHRVTLYRYQRYCFWPRGRGRWYWPWGRAWGKLCHPWSGWLVPVVRAGPRSAGSTVFYVGDGSSAEGVCGAAFSQQSGMLLISGADVPDITQNSSEADILEYARLTFVSVDMIRQRKRQKRPCARYFLALQVEVQSKKWGVLMIDSRAEALPQPNVALHRFSQVKDVLDNLLRRA